jgi:DNA-binding SARP family transcriptional activator/tetratricopeptide (TPR) repeat protein
VVAGGQRYGFRVLGSLEVQADDRVLEVGGPRLRVVLALLVADAGRVVSLPALVEGLWGERPPADADHTVRTYVSLLRKALLSAAGRELIVTRPPGYALAVAPDAVDAMRFERLATEGRRALESGQPQVAAERLTAALELWRGDAYGEFSDIPALRAESARLSRLHLATVEERIAADLAVGTGAALIPELEELTRQHPGHERLWAQLMTALYRAGRQTDALAAYQRVREVLIEESGLAPSPALADLQRQILAHDPRLVPDSAAHTANAPIARTADRQGTDPTQLPRAEPAITDLATPDGNRSAGHHAGEALPRHANRPGAVSTLPADTGAFTGRAREIEQITAAATGGQVLVIHAIAGMPGIGKTALAVHVAHQLGEQFPDGRVFVDLHGHTAGRSPAEPGDVLARLLAADGVDPRQLPTGTEARSALWRARLAGRRALIVLDNAVDSTQVSPLLPASTGCLVLVTSRRFLGDLPTDTVPVSLDVLTAGEAEQMFRHLAPHAGAHAEQVAELMAACGYLPLAVSLLARLLHRHRGWTVADLLTETRTRLLDLAAEHASIRAAFDLSYQHLPAARQRFLRHLALHPGTQIEPHAAAALAGVQLDEATGLLDALHTDSLLIEIGYHRYAMHDLIRTYASTLATHDPTADRRTATDRLLDFYQHTASTANARLSRLTRPTTAQPGPDLPYPAGPDQALSWLRTERANLLACLANTDDPRRIVALTAGLTELLRRDGPWTDALTLHARAAQVAASLGDKLEHANALHDLATVSRLSGDYPAAAQDMRLALDIYRQLDNRLGEANALTGLSKTLARTADYAAAAVLIEQAQDVYRDLGDQPGEAGALVELAITRGMTSDFQGAQEVLRPALALYQQLGDHPGQAYALRMLATAHCRLGDFTGARDLLHLALDLYRQLGSRSGQALTLTDLGWAIAGTGDYPEATRCLRTALGLHGELDHRVGQSTALLFLGGALRRAGDLPGATEALREALVLNRDIHNRSGEVWTLNELGTVHHLAGDLNQAMTAHQQALELAEMVHSPLDKAQALAGFGRCALARGQHREGTAQLREALDILHQINAGEAAEVAAELAALT